MKKSEELYNKKGGSWSGNTKGGSWTGDVKLSSEEEISG